MASNVRGSFGVAAILAVGGCASPPEMPVVATVVAGRPAGVAPSKASPDIQLAAATEPATSNDSTRPRPAYATLETMPIDLPTVIRLIDESSPAVGFARARVREAEARLAQAEVQWLPNHSVGSAYTRFDGQTQNQRGDIFGVSRANLFVGGGPALSLDVAEAIYRPLVERRATAAERLRERATTDFAELDGALAYFDLVQAHALLAINRETLDRAEAMLVAAKNAREAKLDRTAGDVQRAQTEVLLRRAERIELDGKAAVAGARLGRLLLLPPNVKLVPADTAIAPIPLIDPASSLDQLVDIATRNRPDLAAQREQIAAAWTRVRRQERGPLLPKVIVANQTGSFGGGLNDDLTQFDARNALSVQLFWEVKNLGFGNRAEADEKRAALDQARLQLVDAQAKAMADIVEAAQTAAARYETLDLAEQAVEEATELYRISREGTFNVIDAKNLFDALRPLQAIQVLNQSRQSYLAAVVDFNRAQYRLFTLLGHPTSRVPLAAERGG